MVWLVVLFVKSPDSPGFTFRSASWFMLACASVVSGYFGLKAKTWAKRRAYCGLGLAIAMHLFGGILRTTESDLIGGFGALTMFIGFGVFVGSCVQYAEAKGYPKSVGAWGLLWIVGFLVLVVLPDKCKIMSEA